MSRICHVVGAGDFFPHLFQASEEDLIIAADGGYDHLLNMGVTPHFYVGDSDSLGYTPTGIDTVLLPTVKDDTDLHAALKEGLARGCRDFRLYGALGGSRFSHSLGAMQLLLFLEKEGARGLLIHENYTVSLLTEGSYRLNLAGGYFSLFDFEGGGEISISEAKYPLNHAALPSHLTLGVSNEGTAESCITVHRGKFFLVREP